MSESVVINKWPDSQKCMECEYSIFVESGFGDIDRRDDFDFFGPAAYACKMEQDAEICIMMKIANTQRKVGV